MDSNTKKNINRYIELSIKFREPLNKHVKKGDYTSSYITGGSSSIIGGGLSSYIKPNNYNNVIGNKPLPCNNGRYNYTKMKFEMDESLTIPEKIIAKSKEVLENSKNVYNCYKNNLEDIIRKEYEEKLARSKSSLKSAERSVIGSENKAKLFLEYQEMLELEKEIKEYIN